MKAKNYMFMTAAALAFAACSNENDQMDNGPVAAEINAKIGNMMTRASGTAWTDGTDAIGVTVVSVANNGKTTGANVKYNKTVDGWAADSVPIYFEDLNEVTFRAYYPFQGTNGTDAGTIDSITTENQAEQSKFDFMFASGAKASKGSPTVNFTNVTDDYRFKHCMSQLTLKFVAGAGVTLSNKLTAYTLKGLIMEGTFNTGTGVATAKSVAGKDLSFNLTVSDEQPYTAAPVILYPQSTTDNKFKIEVTVEGQPYKATLDLPVDTDNQFKAGYNLKYTITINKTGLQVGTAEIAGWQDVSGTNGTAEM